jgi:hypothetical protein
MDEHTWRDAMKLWRKQATMEAHTSGKHKTMIPNRTVRKPWRKSRTAIAYTPVVSEKMQQHDEASLGSPLGPGILPTGASKATMNFSSLTKPD